MEKVYNMTWEKYFDIVHKVYISPKFNAAIKSMVSFYPLTEDDTILASILSEHTGLKIVDEPDTHSIIVSNVVDTGKSIGKYPKRLKVVLVSRQKIDTLSPYLSSDLYVQFPWENTNKNLVDTIRYIISTVGGDTSKLDHVPDKIVLLFDTLFEGYNKTLSIKKYSVKNKTAISTKHRFFSMDDESGLPFYGTVHIAYFPSMYVIDNPENVVDHCSRKITNINQIADEVCSKIQNKIKPKGLIVKVTAISTYKKYLKERGKIKAMATKGDTSLLWKVI